MTIISFIILVVGGFNWLSIGLLQYDFVAGFFGTQASIFSRLVYIAIGVACAYVLFDILKNRGKLLLFNKHRKTEATKPQQSRDILAD
ncbi:MAG: DUF378 domain-containing protein [Clostridia bacterium]|nr:DUF378 domain-containing protein [Clostridia bacterium]